jgi:hypothetical protein
VHEVEALIFDAVKQSGSGGGVDEIPTHMRQDRSRNPLDSFFEDRETLHTSALGTALKEDLKSYAKSQSWTSSPQSLCDDLITTNRPKSGHALPECTDTRDDESIGIDGDFKVARDDHGASRGRKRSLYRSDVSGTVVENCGLRGATHNGRLLNVMERSVMICPNGFSSRFLHFSSVWDALERALGRGDSADARVQRDSVSKRTRHRFELSLEDVMGIPSLKDSDVKRNAGLSHDRLPDVLTQSCVEGTDQLHDLWLSVDEIWPTGEIHCSLN